MQNQATVKCLNSDSPLAKAKVVLILKWSYFKSFTVLCLTLRQLIMKQ